MAKRNRKSMFRDFKMKDSETLGRSYNKYHRLAVRDIVGNQDITESQLHFLIFIYDYEFFTLDHISENYFQQKRQLARRLVYPLQQKGHIYKYYDKLSPSSYEEAIFHESKMNYRVRYALTQKGRLLVQRYYRKIEGDEQINVPF